jgi:hypothetical protein
LTEEEAAIQYVSEETHNLIISEVAKNYCQDKLQPRVIEAYRNVRSSKAVHVLTLIGKL